MDETARTTRHQGAGPRVVVSEKYSQSSTSSVSTEEHCAEKIRDQNDGVPSPKTMNLNYSANASSSDADPRGSRKEAPTRGRLKSASCPPRLNRRESSSHFHNGTPPRYTDMPEISVEDEGDPRRRKREFTIFLSETADLLARLDNEAYRHEERKDIDAVLFQFVLPMSLPWTHNVGRSRLFARDIDELEGIVQGEEELPGADRLGEVSDINVCTIPQKHSVAARRDNEDPGIIKAVRFRTPRFFDLPTDLSSSDKVDASRRLGESQTRKRRRVEVREANMEEITVSLCFGGSSSRSTLRPPSVSKGNPLMLLAKLPEELSVGQKGSATGISELGTFLGSYDVRHGQSRNLESTSGIRAGRVRNIWTSKENLSRATIHKSMLTGSIVQNDECRRPSRVRVFLRHAGRLLVSDKNWSRSNVPSDDVLAGSPYSSQEVAAAIEAAEEGAGESEYRVPSTENLQCTFNIEEYINGVGSNGARDALLIDRIHKPFLIELNKKDRLWLHVRPPSVWSQPCEDGVVQVVCTRPGELRGVQYLGESMDDVSASKDYPWTTAILLDEMAKQHQCCSICWSESSADGENRLVICAFCQLVVHAKCYGGRRLFDSHWCCDSCSDYQTRASTLPPSLTPRVVRWARKCSICVQFGSAVKQRTQTGPYGLYREWVHPSCMAWESSKSFEEGVCILCSKPSRFLVRCAATGCSLRFHPMCAKVISHAAALNRSRNHTFTCGSIEVEEAGDIFLSSQYCQETIAVRSGKNIERAKSIPIAYCGLHNPLRASDRIGLMPGGAFFNDAVRLPLTREWVDQEG